MLFNSLEFLIFFPIVVLAYYLLPKRIRYLWLLISSYYFYMCWNAKYALLLLTASALFAIQIYCDFAGYSTIAMGAAKVLNINLMKNFDAPYLSMKVAILKRSNRFFTSICAKKHTKPLWPRVFFAFGDFFTAP